MLQYSGIGCKGRIIVGQAVLSHAAGLCYVVYRIARPCVVVAGIRRPTPCRTIEINSPLQRLKHPHQDCPPMEPCNKTQRGGRTNGMAFPMMLREAKFCNRSVFAEGHLAVARGLLYIVNMHVQLLECIPIPPAFTWPVLNCWACITSAIGQRCSFLDICHKHFHPTWVRCNTGLTSQQVSTSSNSKCSTPSEWCYRHMALMRIFLGAL